MASGNPTLPLFTRSVTRTEVFENKLRELPRSSWRERSQVAGLDPNETIATAAFGASKCTRQLDSYQPRFMAGSMQFRGYV